MRWPCQSIGEYRGAVFVTCSPIVFHTAPPQPASNARMICSPQLVGGADASQNGFIQRMPANVVSSVGIFTLQPGRNSYAGPFSIGHRVHNFAAAVRTVAAREVLRVRRL